MVTLTRLFIHPVKSMRGIGLTHALADISGLAFDRIFMITEPDGTFITARQFPQMVRFTPSPFHDGLHLTAPDGSSALVRFADFATQMRQLKYGETILPRVSHQPLSTNGLAAFSPVTCSYAGSVRS